MDAVGPGVDPAWEGRLVMSVIGGGGYAEHVVIDARRTTVTARSAGEIRRNLYDYWSLLPHTVQSFFVKRIAFVGTESTGKTTLAQMLAHHSGAEFIKLSAVLSGVREIRAAVDRAKLLHGQGRTTVLFIDEVHRFNKSQQDAFLPYVENGTIYFIGATTENPSFELNNALLSRARVYVLKPLPADAIRSLLLRALGDARQGLGELGLTIGDHGLDTLAEAYLATDPQYSDRVTVPVLWDRRTGAVVNNESAEIIRMFNGAFDGLTGDFAYHREAAEQGLAAAIRALALGVGRSDVIRVAGLSISQ